MALWIECGVGDLIFFFVWTGRTEEGWKLCEGLKILKWKPLVPSKQVACVALTNAIRFLSNKWAGSLQTEHVTPIH